MVLWQSPDTPIMSGFSCERAASSVLESRALSSAYIVLCGAWCLDPGTYVLSFGSCRGSHTRAPFSVIVWVRSRVRSIPHTLVQVCFVVLHAVRVSIGCCICYILCCVARSLYIHWLQSFHVVMSCVNTWLMSFLISCLFMSCFAHGWWFVCWPCACVSVLCEHLASVLVFCVPCAHVNLSWPHPSCYLFID